MKYITENGYEIVDTLSGVDVYDSDGCYVCNLQGVHISEFMDENENVDDSRLDSMIDMEMEAICFIEDQANYI